MNRVLVTEKYGQRQLETGSQPRHTHNTSLTHTSHTHTLPHNTYHHHISPTHQVIYTLYYITQTTHNTPLTHNVHTSLYHTPHVTIPEHTNHTHNVHTSSYHILHITIPEHTLVTHIRDHSQHIKSHTHTWWPEMMDLDHISEGRHQNIKYPRSEQWSST